MLDWLTAPAVVAAVISAFVAAIGVAVSIVTTRRELSLKYTALETQVKLKTQELEAQANLKARDLEALASQLRTEQEAVRQQQLTEILKKKIETYPALYEIIAKYGRNWEIHGKPFDQEWAKQFLVALLEINAHNGVFFSQPVYESFHDLRTCLIDIKHRLAGGGAASPDELNSLYAIIRGPYSRPDGSHSYGLGTKMKDDLGSYVTPIASASHPAATSLERKE